MGKHALPGIHIVFGILKEIIVDLVWKNLITVLPSVGHAKQIPYVKLIMGLIFVVLPDREIVFVITRWAANGMTVVEIALALKAMMRRLAVGS